MAFIQIEHCGEIVETLRTADETGLDVGDYFRLIGQKAVFECQDINRAWPRSPVVSGLTLDRQRYTQARLCDVIRCGRSRVP